MGHKKLSERLDYLSSEDLGIPFDDDHLWNRLESQLSARKRVIWLQRIAAVVGLLLISLPISLREEESIPGIITQSAQTQEVEAAVQKEVIDQTSKMEPPAVASKQSDPLGVFQMERKKVEVAFAETSNIPRKLNRLQQLNELESTQPFAAKDISIIQASLGKPTIEKGSTMAIRAQWAKSSTKTNVEYQALKLRLNEKNE